MTTTNNHGPPVFEGKPAAGTLQQGWYQAEVDDVQPDERELLEKYSGIPSAQVLPHVLALRDNAFKIWSYACIGQMRFLAFHTKRMPYYEDLVQRLKGGATFCDAGCCFGQEIRHLVFTHNLDSSRMYGFDLELDFIQMGYELFKDKDRLKATFTAGNVLEEAGQGNKLDQFERTMDIIFCSSFLHVFDWDAMKKAACRLVSLSTPRAGSVICGKQLGSVKAGSYKMPTASGSNYRHNVESMQRFWQEIGKETQSQWKVESGMYDGFELVQNTNHAWSDENQKMIWFKATRL